MALSDAGVGDCFGVGGAAPLAALFQDAVLKYCAPRALHSYFSGGAGHANMVGIACFVASHGHRGSLIARLVLILVL